MFGNRNNTRDRPVCQFFLEGRCRFGDNCKNEHPNNQNGQNTNRFAPLDNQQRGRSGGFGNGQASQTQSQHKIDPDLIKSDLSVERPIWPLSSYGPGKNPPRNLISSNMEHSPEEMRVLHYLAVAQGNPQETLQREATMMQEMDATIQRILNDLPKAVKYVMDGFDQHPNRIDQANAPDGIKPPSSTAFGQTPNPLQTNMSQTSTFGQSSSFGKPSTFGQASAPAQTSAFGQPSKLGAAPGFGQPSFGQASQPSSGFAQAASRPAFGQTGFGSSNTQTSAFGQTSTPQSTFGQPSAPQSTFGQPSAFGTTSQIKSTFGQPSAFGAAAAAPQNSFGQTAAFGSAATKTSPFASSSRAPQTSSFGTPSAFGAAVQTASPFAAAAAPSTASQFASSGNVTQSPFGQNNAQSTSQNPFGQSSTQTQQTTAFGQLSQPSPFGQPSQSQNNASTTAIPSHITLDASGQPISFKGRPVARTSDTPATYVARNQQTGKDERIWFPAGEPKATSDVVAPEACYQGEIGQQLEKLYAYTQQHSIFEGGIMPETPPQRAWVSFEI